MTMRRLADWGWPPVGELSTAAALVVAELASNAVLHGRLPGRYFELRLAVFPDASVLRIEVSDARGERRPEAPTHIPGPEAERGRGLLLVDCLALRWGVLDRLPVGKTVWAELEAAA
ncbi:ATP-binding protein [Peterkaempfera bronchialis]